jgi:ankyrin repeat protein
MWASQEGDTATVQVLLRAGADKEARNAVRDRKSDSHAHVYDKRC